MSAQPKSFFSRHFLDMALLIVHNRPLPKLLDWVATKIAKRGHYWVKKRVLSTLVRCVVEESADLHWRAAVAPAKRENDIRRE